MTRLKTMMKSALVLALFTPSLVLAQVFPNSQPLPTSPQVTLSDENTIGEFEVQHPRTVNMTQADFNAPGNSAAVLVRARVGLHYSFGSGMFISPNVFVTAAHVFNNDDGTPLPADAYAYTQGSNSAYQAGTFEPNGISYAFTGADMHYYNKTAYKPSTPTDLVAVVVKTPMQLTYPGAEFNELASTTANLSQVRTLGYPANADGTNLVLGALYQSIGNLTAPPSLADIGMGMSDGDSIEGVSGGGVLNSSNQVVGIHTNAFLFDTGNKPGFIKFSPEQRQWLNNLVEANKVTGWKEYNGDHYYFDQKGRLLKNQTKTLDGEEYNFDSTGKATALNQTRTAPAPSSTTPSSSASTSNSNSTSSTSTSSTTKKTKTDTTTSSSQYPSKFVKPRVKTDQQAVTATKSKTSKTTKNYMIPIVSILVACFTLGFGGSIYLSRK